MDEPGWLTSPDPDLMLDFILAKAGDRKLRLFACACCRHVWHLIPPYHRRTVEVAERYADGLATREELTRSYQITADTPEDHEGDFDPAAEGDDYDPFVVPQPSNATTACADSSALEAARDTSYWCASLAAWTRPKAVFETEREAQAAILRQLSAQARHCRTHSSMSPTCSQLLAHASQTSAQARQVCLCSGVPISMKCAEVRHISAQAIIKRKCPGSTCLPPAGRQWFEAMPRQVW